MRVVSRVPLNRTLGLAFLLTLRMAGATAAQTADSASTQLSDSIAAALRQAAIPPTASAVVVQPLSGSGVSIAVNTTIPMHPESTMKLVTTYAALNLLGPACTWRT